MEGLAVVDQVILSPLGGAACKGDVAAVKQLLQQGHSVNLTDNRGWAPIHSAACGGHLHCTKILLEHEECNVSARTYDGMTAVFVACKYQNNPELVRLLINSGVDCQIANNEKETPLHIACTRLSSSLVNELVAAGANTNAQDFNSYTPLMNAIDQYGKCRHRNCNDQENMKTLACLLLRHGANLTATELNGRTPLTLAVCSEWEDGVQLLQSGSDVNARTCDGATALLLAAQKGNLAILCHLLNFGANPHIACSNGTLPLHLALHNGHISIAEELLKKMNISSLFRKDFPLSSFLILAIDSGSFHSFKFVMDHKLIFPTIDRTPVSLQETLLSDRYFRHYKTQSALSFLLCHHIDETHSLPMLEYILKSESCSVNAEHENDMPPLCALLGAKANNLNSEVYCENKKICFFKLLERGAEMDYCSVEDQTQGLRIPDPLLAVLFPVQCTLQQNLLLPVLTHCFSCLWDELFVWLLKYQVCSAVNMHTLLCLEIKTPPALLESWKCCTKCSCLVCCIQFPKLQLTKFQQVKTLQSLSRSAVRSWLWQKTHLSNRAIALLKKLSIPKIVKNYIMATD